MAAEHAPVTIELASRFRELPPAIENGDTFEQNAIIKARHYGQYTEGLLFADDSGLEVDALGGAPGVYSARFAGPGATDEANNRLLLQKLEGIGNPTARFVCAIALVEGDTVRGVYRGSVEGFVVRDARGHSGFGYDPLFYYPPFQCTFGEATDQQKFSVSHRGQALREMLAGLTR
jgi:XTP/dITP diphosphohydrolase